MIKLLIIFLTLSLNVWAASFPTTPILDTATRANENPLSFSGKWTTASGINALKIASNEIAPQGSAQESASYWNVAKFKDAEAYFTVNTALTVTNDHINVFVRLDGVALNGYFAQYARDTVGGDNINICRLDAGVSTTLATFPQGVSVGDSVGVAVSGNTITAWYKPAAGSWTYLGKATDTTYSTANNIGLDINAVLTTAGAINFGGGMIVTDVMFGDIL